MNKDNDMLDWQKDALVAGMPPAIDSLEVLAAIFQCWDNACSLAEAELPKVLGETVDRAAYEQGVLAAMQDMAKALNIAAAYFAAEDARFD